MAKNAKDNSTGDFFPFLNVAKIIAASRANGPGERIVIWLQGCPIRCKGCNNVPLWPFIEKDLFTPEELFNKVLELKSIHPNIEGITISGGEPLVQLRALSIFLDKIRKNTDLSIIVFTGYTEEEIELKNYKRIYDLADILIVGPYIEELSVLKTGSGGTGSANTLFKKYPLRGSSNQKLLFLTERYGEESLNENEIEIIISPDGNEIDITGFPTDDFIDSLKKP